jgi:DNA-binding MarR family transcriptional regulator
MERDGLVTRERDPGDERFVHVALAERGEDLREHASRIHCDMKDAIGLDEDDFAALQQTLRTLTGRVTG